MVSGVEPPFDSAQGDLVPNRNVSFKNYRAFLGLDAYHYKGRRFPVFWW
jgi:hypothetical protein